ncbi:hypothetical protein E3N88_35759 [Mikania micrantha]|uniref:BED-type domain-containing protein n=1 Tax=Mikania micrantha TaxID=192012 RepID=A0A5N6M1U7_9ASTR|nr:hypothetical protein E3N88_35759 [Mikania micrantha]
MDEEGEGIVGCDSSNTQKYDETNQHSQEHQSTNTDKSQEQEQFNNNDKKRKASSPAWEHFTNLIINGEKKAECVYCKAKLGAKSTNGTRHLLAHMDSCKKRKNKDIRQQVLSMNQIKTTGQSDLSCYNFDADKSRKDLTEMVVMHEYPLSVVEHHGFRKFVGGLQPFFKVPSRNTLKTDIFKIFEYEKKKTMSKQASEVVLFVPMVVMVVPCSFSGGGVCGSAGHLRSHRRPHRHDERDRGLRRRRSMVVEEIDGDDGAAEEELRGVVVCSVVMTTKT